MECVISPRVVPGALGPQPVHWDATGLDILNRGLHFLDDFYSFYSFIFGIKMNEIPLLIYNLMEFPITTTITTTGLKTSFSW